MIYFPMKTVAVAALLLPGAAHASTRTSADYSIVTETFDEGGRRTTSSNYTIDGSITPIAGISTVASPAEILKSGYAAQLYDITGLAVAAATAPAIMPGGGTLQLGAFDTLDDATFLAVPSTSVAWSVTSGPISSISASGLATAQAVTGSVTAVVRAAYHNFVAPLSITVADLTRDSFGLYANDGIDDAWQVQYFGWGPGNNGNPLGAASADADGTGQTNLFKYIAGLDPLNPDSRFALAIQPPAGSTGQQNLIFAPIVAGTSYSVQFSPTLNPANWQPLTGMTQSDSGGVRTVTDPNASGGLKFYRVQVSKP